MQMNTNKVLREAIREILLEAKIDDLKKKYPEHIAILDKLVSGGMKSKYFEWAIKQIISGTKIEDLIPTISFFDKNWQRFKERDINRYTAKSLEDAVKLFTEEEYDHWNELVNAKSDTIASSEEILPYDEIINILSTFGDDDKSPKSYFANESGEQIIAKGKKLKSTTRQTRQDIYDMKNSTNIG